jgi:hypothetical protein
MATCEGCCHLTGAMLNLAAEAADRARITAVRGGGQDPIQLLCNKQTYFGVRIEKRAAAQLLPLAPGNEWEKCFVSPVDARHQCFFSV